MVPATNHRAAVDPEVPSGPRRRMAAESKAAESHCANRVAAQAASSVIHRNSGVTTTDFWPTAGSFFRFPVEPAPVAEAAASLSSAYKCPLPFYTINTGLDANLDRSSVGR